MFRWSFMFSCFVLANCCYIQGTDSGQCVEYDLVGRMDKFPFCYPILLFPVCIPKPQFIPPMKEFPVGRWANHTEKTKDIWVGETFFAFVEERIRIETDRKLKRARTNEYGDKGRIKARFHNHRDCVNAFKNFFCWTNFPRCDMEKDFSYPLCRSVCENYFKACGYKSDLFRCGKTEYMNGYEPEKPSGTDANGGPIYIRDYFPGQPFISNDITKGGNERVICTPALVGAAPSSSSAEFQWVYRITWASVGICIISQFFM